jgi:hypothetical protein
MTILIPRTKDLIPRTTVLIPRTPVLIPRATVLIPRATVLIPRATVLIPTATVLIPRATVLIPRPLSSSLGPLPSSLGPLSSSLGPLSSALGGFSKISSAPEARDGPGLWCGLRCFLPGLLWGHCWDGAQPSGSCGEEVGVMLLPKPTCRASCYIFHNNNTFSCRIFLLSVSDFNLMKMLRIF